MKKAAIITTKWREMSKKLFPKPSETNRPQATPHGKPAADLIKIYKQTINYDFGKC